MKIILGIILIILFVCNSYAGEYSFIRSVAKPIYVNNKIKDDVLSTGSAVVIAPGYILSVAHIIVETKIPFETIVIDGGLKLAKIVKIDRRNDLVLLSADVSCPCAKLFEGEVDIDEPVYSSSFPLFSLYGVQYVTTGIIQKFERKQFATNMQVTLGSSGGPIFVKMNNEYKLFGLVTAVAKSNEELVTWMSYGIRKHVIIDFLSDTPVAVR